MVNLKENININVSEPIDQLELDKDAQRDFWLLLLFRGIALFLFGFISVLWPGATIVVLAYVFAATVLFIGAIDIVNGIRMINSKNLWFLRVILGIVEVAVGLYLLRAGFVVTAVIYLQTLGLILILQSIVELVASINSVQPKGFKTLSIISAVFTFIIGLFLLREPVSSGLTFVWIIGLYGIVAGSFLVAAAFSVRPPKTA